MAIEEKVKVGIIGCGDISKTYFNAPNLFENIEVTACSDLSMELAESKAQGLDNIHACSVDELLEDRDISIAVNLTPPQAHYDISRRILEAGKHVYSEKPMALTTNEASELLKLAEDKNLRFGGAPDTFMGGGLQTCRGLIDDGVIGRPFKAFASMAYHGPADWHHRPHAFYQEGAGPLYDMGPYYIAALVNLIGRIASVNAMATIVEPQVEIIKGPSAGELINVTTPTDISGSMEFESKVIAGISFTFGTRATNLPRLEVYGTKGTLSLPDPNTFGGPVAVLLAGMEEWEEVPLTHGHVENSRGIGLSDMADAIANNRPHRANGELTFHTLEVMEGILLAAKTRREYEVQSPCRLPEPLEPLYAETMWASKTENRKAA
jgi:predicted dehydrogenase